MNLRWKNQFKKDYKLMMKQGMDISKLDYVIEELTVPNKLPESYQDHLLKGEYKGYRDCHLSPDWILIYGFKCR
jgi:mRNA interferase YafQ